MVQTAQGNLHATEPRLRRIKPGAEVVPGITSIDTAGHTPGHISLHVASGRDELLCTGDVVGNRAVSFQRPHWRGGYDMDLDKGARVRRSFLDRCATEKVMVASYHLPFPGIGHVARDGTAFRWVAADWRWEM
jgi:glyoxylase-like metal-dependent hydrolase (beta-lactamase superfamily II)